MRGECEVLFGRWEALLAVEEEISNRLLLIRNQSSGNDQSLRQKFGIFKYR